MEIFTSKDGMFYQQKLQIYRIEVRVSSKHMYSNPEKQQKHTYKEKRYTENHYLSRILRFYPFGVTQNPGIRFSFATIWEASAIDGPHGPFQGNIRE